MLNKIVCELVFWVEGEREILCNNKIYPVTLIYSNLILSVQSEKLKVGDRVEFELKESQGGNKIRTKVSEILSKTQSQRFEKCMLL